MRRTLILLTISLPLFVQHVHAQLLDSLLVQVGTTGTFATKDYQPLWITAQHFGALTDRKSDLSTQAGFSNAHILGRNGQFYIRYGLNLVNNDHFGNVIVQEGYVKAGFKHLEIRAGRFREVIGEVDKDLSSGSLGVSGNAVPIPQIGIAVPEYTDVPFTDGWLQFKGQFTHGWMGERQFIKDAWLHQKTFYVRVGKRKLKVGAGLEHFAVWGGHREGLPKIDNSLKGFWNVFTAREANDGTVGGDIGGSVIRPNRAGDHRGVIEGTIDWENDVTGLHLYMQMPFESSQGMNIKNIDRLLGVAYTNKHEGAWLHKIVGEFIYTKQMNDWYIDRVRESYYNNGIYMTGWEYQDRIVGTPLFTDRIRTNKYFPGQTPPYDWNAPLADIKGQGPNIVNNRIVGGHLGLQYTIGQMLQAKTLITYTQNYGNIHAGPYGPSKSQCYTLEELSYTLPSMPLTVHAGVAVDFGELSDNAGLMLGVSWQFRKFNEQQ